MLDSIKDEIKNILVRHSAFTELDLDKLDYKLSNETLILNHIIESSFEIEKKCIIISEIYNVNSNIFNDISTNIYKHDYDIEFQPIISAEYYDDNQLTLTRLLIKLTMLNHSQPFNEAHSLYNYLCLPRNNSAAVLLEFINNGLDIKSLYHNELNCVEIVNRLAKFEINDQESQKNIADILDVLFKNGFIFSDDIEELHAVDIFVTNKISLMNLEKFYTHGYPRLTDMAAISVCKEQYLKLPEINIDFLIMSNLHTFVFDGVNAYSLIACDVLNRMKKNMTWNEQHIKDIEKLSLNNVDIKGLVPKDERSMFLSRNNLNFLNFFIHSGMAEKYPETLLNLISNSENDVNIQFNSTVNFAVSPVIIELRKNLSVQQYLKIINTLEEKNYHLNFNIIASIKNNVSEQMLEEIELLNDNFYKYFFNYIEEYENLMPAFIRNDFEKILNYMNSTLEKEIEYLETSGKTVISSYWQKNVLVEKIKDEQAFSKKQPSRL